MSPRRPPRKPRIYPGYPNYEIEYADSERSKRAVKILSVIFYSYMAVCFVGAGFLWIRGLARWLLW